MLSRPRIFSRRHWAAAAALALPLTLLVACSEAPNLSKAPRTEPTATAEPAEPGSPPVAEAPAAPDDWAESAPAAPEETDGRTANEREAAAPEEAAPEEAARSAYESERAQREAMVREEAARRAEYERAAAERARAASRPAYAKKKAARRDADSLPSDASGEDAATDMAPSAAPPTDAMPSEAKPAAPPPPPVVMAPEPAPAEPAPVESAAPESREAESAAAPESAPEAMPPMASEMPDPYAPAGPALDVPERGGMGTSGAAIGGGGSSYGGGAYDSGAGSLGSSAGTENSSSSAAGGGASSMGAGVPGAPVAAAPKNQEPFEVVPVYYGTDRAVEPSVKRLEYGSVRAHRLELGRALVSVPTSHTVPNIERPWVIEIPYFKYKIYEEKEDPAKHFAMQEIAALSKQELLAYIRARLEKSQNFKEQAFVFVHGFNTSFDAAVYRTAQIAYDLDFDGAPFVYSWPSGGKIASYTYDRASAEAAEPHLGEFLEFVIKESGAKSISLIAHSMGNEVLLRVLDRLRLEAPEGVKISQVILAAPDVDRDKFTNIAREISNFAKGVTLYAAANDRALETSARFWGGVPRAGDVPPSGPLIINGVDTIDVTAVSTETLSLNHSSYAENKRLLSDIKRLLQTGKRPPDQREPQIEKVTTAAGTFWRFPAEVAPAAVPTGTVP